MSDIPWWQSAVVYQIYPRSFKDSTGNGVGDLQGIIDKLDYLVELGIDAIWLSPFFKSPMKDFGYDVSDFVDVDPLFGDLETFDRLIEAAHARDIKIIIDYVPNHSSDEHAWFQESRSSRDNPKRDWYIWKDAKPDGSLPNNWGSFFGGPAWSWDERTEQYFFHQFDPGQPDLNWRNPAVRAAMYDALRFWLKRGVDGFRMDVVYMVWKHPEMPDHPLIPGATGRGPDDILGRQEQLYGWNYDGVHDIMKELRATLDEFGDKVMIGEIWLPLEERMRYYGDGQNDEFHMPFNFDLIEQGGAVLDSEGAAEFRFWTPERYRSLIDAHDAAVPAYGWPNYVLGNHDVPRLASRLGREDRARVAAMMLLTLRGTPTIYMGEEIGMLNGVIPPEKIQDPQGVILGPEHTRDVCRTPIQWDESEFAGFSSVEPWLPVHPDAAELNVAGQKDDPASMLSLYKALLTLRKSEPALQIGRYASLDLGETLYAYRRDTEDSALLILLNFASDAVEVVLPAAADILLSTFLDQPEVQTGSVTLRPNEGMVLRLAP